MMPKIENAPGLAWKPRKDGWEARWQARTDLVKRGYPIKSQKVWAGTEAELTPGAIALIQDRCESLQGEMLLWGRGGLVAPAGFDGTLRSLAACYMTDEDSPFKRLRYVSRGYYERLTNKILADHGDKYLTDIRARDAVKWHEAWSEGGKVAMGHAMVGMLRTLINFGVAFLEDEECERLSGGLSKLRFSVAKARTERLTAEQVIAFRKKAHEKGHPFMALAQAIQFECILRQKDVIGEWVPVGEPGLSDLVSEHLGRQFKWLRGLRWEEIDANLTLRHVTSKRGKPVEVPLRDAPMVMEEFARWPELPKSGPVIISEFQGLPYHQHNFRRLWREIAEAAGIPKSVRNMDSRAGAITEATEAGADLEHVKHAATHSDIGMTQRYSRGGEQKTANVLRIRAESRNKKRTV